MIRLADRPCPRCKVRKHSAPTQSYCTPCRRAYERELRDFKRRHAKEGA